MYIHLIFANFRLCLFAYVIFTMGFLKDKMKLEKFGISCLIALATCPAIHAETSLPLNLNNIERIQTSSNTLGNTMTLADSKKVMNERAYSWCHEHPRACHRSWCNRHPKECKDKCHYKSNANYRSYQYHY